MGRPKKARVLALGLLLTTSASGMAEAGAHLEHSQERLGEVVEGAPLGLGFVEIKLPTKQLHAQQGEDDDEEEEQQQQ